MSALAVMTLGPPGERVRSGRGSLTRPLLLVAGLLLVPAAGFAVCWAAARAVVE